MIKIYKILFFCLLFLVSCGKDFGSNQADSDTLVFNGYITDSRLRNIVFKVLIRYQDSTSRMCSAFKLTLHPVLNATDVLVTAAHCLEKPIESLMLYLAGSQ